MNSGEILLEYVSRHLGALGVQYVIVKPDGAESEEHVAAYSGFFLTLGENWYFVTAGHAFNEKDKGVHELQKQGRIRVTQCSINDYFRQSAKHAVGIPVDFDSLPVFSVFDQANELDFALIGLRPFYVDALRANDVRPITDTNIDATHGYPELQHRVLGFPNEATVCESGVESITTWLQPSFVAVERLPDDAPLAKAKPQMIAARLLADELKSPVGLSGGAVFALTRLPNNETGYWVVGIQSCWDPNTRTVYACPIQRAVKIFLDHIKSQTA